MQRVHIRLGIVFSMIQMVVSKMQLMHLIQIDPGLSLIPHTLVTRNLQLQAIIHD